jgi:hypothetical protein
MVPVPLWQKVTVPVPQYGECYHMQDLDMTSMARKVDPREAAAKRAAEEATRKALADKKAREAADTKAAEMAAALKAVQKKEAEEVGGCQKVR